MDGVCQSHCSDHPWLDPRLAAAAGRRSLFSADLQVEADDGSVSVTYVAGEGEGADGDFIDGDGHGREDGLPISTHLAPTEAFSPLLINQGAGIVSMPIPSSIDIQDKQSTFFFYVGKGNSECNFINRYQL